MLVKKLISFLSAPKSPIEFFYKSPRYNDEPLLYQYNAIFTENKLNEWGGGCSFSKEKAIIKAIGEALERYCLGKLPTKKLIKARIKDLNGPFLDPLQVISFSDAQYQQKSFSRFRFDKESNFRWVIGTDLINRRKVFIPAQLVYVPYQFDDEPVIRLPISTGAAFGDSQVGALYRGICEVIERDAFMIYYLNKLTPLKIDLTQSTQQLHKNYQYFRRYRLDLHVLDITTDIGVPVIMAIIIDETKLGPKISIGLKCSLNVEEAIIGAIEEAQHTRIWMRNEREKVNPAELIGIKRNPGKLADPKERGLFWYDKNPRELNFWLNKRVRVKRTRTKLTLKFKKEEDHRRLFSGALNIIKDFGYTAFFVDITTPEIAQAGYCVVKVALPNLQPFYLEERYKYLGGTRLYEVPVKLGYTENAKKLEELNNTPHPFL